MALDNTGADAAVEAYLNTFSPPMTDDQKAAARPGLQPLFRSIFAGIAASAVVNPGGMNVGGTAVTGTGTLT